MLIFSASSAAAIRTCFVKNNLNEFIEGSAVQNLCCARCCSIAVFMAFRSGKSIIWAPQQHLMVLILLFVAGLAALALFITCGFFVSVGSGRDNRFDLPASCIVLCNVI